MSDREAVDQALARIAEYIRESGELCANALETRDGVPERMTYDEWAERALRKECVDHGHNFEHVVMMYTGQLLRVTCARCGDSWRVTEEVPNE